MRPRIGQLLLDFDGVLATHHRDRRLAALAAHAGVEVATVHAVLYTSGLERRYDAGLVDTTGYLRTLGDGLGRTVDEAAWLAARRAASVPDAGAQAWIAALPADLPLGVLTNNGPLMATLIPELLPSLAERLRGKVLCSGPRRSPGRSWSSQPVSAARSRSDAAAPSPVRGSRSTGTAARYRPLCR